MSNLNILYIEDDTAQRQAFLEQAEKHGFIVDAASSGDEGVRKFHSSDTDVVLCDLNMPGMGGLEVLNEIKKVSPDFPFIVMTAHGTVELAVQAIKQGADDFIIKPLDFELIQSKINRAIESHKLKADLKISHDEEESLRYRTVDLEKRIEQSTKSLSDANRELSKSYKRTTELLSTVVEVSPIPYIVSRLIDGKVLFANEPLANLMGVPTNQVIGRTTVDFYADPKDREKVIEQIKKHGFIRDYEVRIKKSDGEIIWMILNLIASEFSGEKVIIGGLYDIDVRRKAEEALRESEERFRQIAENINEVFWLASTEADKVLYVSPKFKEVLGIDPEILEMDQEEWLKHIHPDDASIMRDSCDTEEISERTIEYRLIRENGSIKWIRAKAFPIRNSKGEIYRICGVSEDISDRKETEENLALYKRIFMAASDGIVITDPDGNILSRNPAHERSSGYSDDELIGKHISHMTGESFSKGIKRSIAETGNFRGETRIQAKDGSVYHVDMSIFPVQNDDGEITRIVGMGRDITARKRDQEIIAAKLRYEVGIAECSQALLEIDDMDSSIENALGHLLEAADAGRVYLFENFEDPSFGLCMRQCYEVCAPGVKCEIGNPLLQNLPYKAGFEHWIDNLKRGEPYYAITREQSESVKLILEDQGVKSIIVLPIYVDGEWYGFIGFDDLEKERDWDDEEIRLLRTASEMIGGYISRGRALEALSISEERFRSLVENANDIIYSLNLNGEFTYLSPKFKEATGYEVKAWLGRKNLDLIDNPDHSGFRKWLRSTTAPEARREEYEFKIRNKGGDVRWFVTHASVLIDADNNPSEIIGVAHDITELKKALEDFAQANISLKNTQTQLVQSEKMASLGMLVAGIAHEINTPIGAVNSMHDTLILAINKLKSSLKIICSNSDYNGETLQNLLKIIEDANRVITSGTDRVTEIVRRLRSFARLDEAELKDADIHEGLEDTLTLVHHELKHNITIHRNYGDIPVISCYPGQLNQVFMNLLINARQSILGKGEITISTSSKKKKVHIEIMDTGSGIPQDKLERIFDPGFTTKGVGIGTGLGLSICYQIIQDHKGEIKAESEIGKGTKFTIILPTNLK